MLLYRALDGLLRNIVTISPGLAEGEQSPRRELSASSPNNKKQL